MTAEGFLFTVIEVIANTSLKAEARMISNRLFRFFVAFTPFTGVIFLISGAVAGSHVAAQGASAFYDGPIAAAIVSTVRSQFSSNQMRGRRQFAEAS